MYEWITNIWTDFFYCDKPKWMGRSVKAYCENLEQYNVDFAHFWLDIDVVVHSLQFLSILQSILVFSVMRLSSKIHPRNHLKPNQSRKFSLIIFVNVNATVFGVIWEKLKRHSRVCNG